MIENIGIVEDKTADYYRININSTNTVYCSRLGFEGATKRNKPELKRGSVLYGRICSVDNERQMDTEMTCISNNGVKKEWSSGETVRIACRWVLYACAVSNMCRR